MSRTEWISQTRHFLQPNGVRARMQTTFLVGETRQLQEKGPVQMSSENASCVTPKDRLIYHAYRLSRLAMHKTALCHVCASRR